MRRALVLCLVICISAVPIPARSASDVQPQSAKELKRQAALKEKIEFMGLGAQIRVVTLGSSNVTYEGTIDEIAAENFKLKMKNQTLPFQYNQIRTVTLKDRRYKTLGQPDPVRIRQIVADMGVGEKAKVELTSNERFSGTIQSIQKDGFVISPQNRPVKFSEVKEIKKKQFPTWAKAAIIVGIAIAALDLLMYAACGSAGCH